MELAEFERVYDSFCAFHAEFAPDFGRKQWRENSDDYLQGLLVQAEERRNAENLAEAHAARGATEARMRFPVSVARAFPPTARR